ncbi:uncharacterized protein LOC134215670 [Armigeres subalbatus]|uniref:uncharacterized protein LOC134215670 n=1 Tax=Armigeres subalbatus TaxID=124917 RepID=UPI002ED3D12C
MSASLFSRLDPFDCQKGDFDYYLEQFQNFLELNSVEDESKKVPLFISSIGQDAYKILKEICAPSDPKEKSFDQMKTLLVEYFARREFYRRNQRPGEYTGVFVNELKRLSIKCNFGPFAHEALRDRIACGKLPEEATDKKPAAPAASDASKKAKTQQPQKPSVPLEVQLVAEKKAKAKPAAIETGFVVVNPDSVPKQPKGPKQQKSGGPSGQQKQHKCKICGHEHKESECPHKDSMCFKCDKKGHIASVCREKINKGQKQQQQQPVQVHVHVQQNTAMKN